MATVPDLPITNSQDWYAWAQAIHAAAVASQSSADVAKKISDQSDTDLTRFVFVGATAPNPAKMPVWGDTSTTPPTVKTWNGSAWGAVGAGASSSTTTEDIQDAAAALLTSGTHSGITFAYDDAGNRVNATVAGAAGTSYTDEQAQDAAAALFAAGSHTGIVFSYDDAANKMSATVTAAGAGSAAPGVTYVDTYGAKGDGVADDLAAINNAIAATPNGGRLVFTPGKTYLTSDTVQVTNKTGVTVEGYGAKLTTTGSSDTSAVLRVENCSHVVVLGFALSHKNVATRKNDADGLTIAHCSNTLVMAVRVGYVYSIGIRIAGSARTTVIGNTVDGSTADGIGCYGWQRQASNADTSISSGSAVLTSPSSKFQPHDVGSWVTVYGAGPSGGNLLSTIVSYQSASQVTLANAASTTVSSQYVRIARPTVSTTITANHLVNNGDDAISSVGYRNFASMIIGPNLNTKVSDNDIISGGARGIVFVGEYGGTITHNTMTKVKQGGIFISTEPNVGGSWGCRDIIVRDNVLETINTDYGVGNSNYGAIFVNSIFGEYPVENVIIEGNTIRDAFSYYIGVGGDTGSNDSTGTREIIVRGNVMVGGNRNNNGVQVIKSTNVTVVGNRIDRARTGALYVAAEVAGTVIVRDNIVSNYDRAGQGYGALSVNPSGAIVSNNVVNGVNVASGTSGGGANASGGASTGGAAATGLKTTTPPGSVTNGLLLWLEAENLSGVADGAALATLLDGSGNTRNGTQSTAAAQPTYRSTSSTPALPNGKPFAFFDGADDFMFAPLPVTAAPLTMFAVLYDPNPTSGYRPYIDLASAGAGGTRFILNTGNGTFSLAGNGASGTTTKNVPASTWFLATVILPGDGTAQFWVNGTQVAVSGNLNTVGTHQTSPGYAMNRYSDGSPSGLGISRAFDAVYNRALSSTERSNIESALKTKYGIS